MSSEPEPVPVPAPQSSPAGWKARPTFPKEAAEAEEGHPGLLGPLALNNGFQLALVVTVIVGATIGLGLFLGRGAESLTKAAGRQRSERRAADQALMEVPAAGAFAASGPGSTTQGQEAVSAVRAAARPEPLPDRGDLLLALESTFNTGE